MSTVVSTPRAGRWRLTRQVLVLAGLLALALPTDVGAIAQDPDNAGATGADARVTTRVSAERTKQVRGKHIRIQPTRRAPRLTTEQKRRLAQANLRQGRLNAPRTRRYNGRMPGAANKAAPRISDTIQNAPETFAIHENRVLPFFAGSLRSPVSEPNGAGNGRMRFVTSNWQAARSVDGGASWAFVNPFANYGFGTNFCCDQVVAYDAGRDRFFWLRQYSDGLQISNSSNLVGWCTYRWTPATFGLGAGRAFDYDRIALTTDYLYISTNVYNGASFQGALVFRIPIAAQVACAATGAGFLGPRATEFSVSFVNGASDTMFWGTNWATGGLTPGSGFRVFEWPDTGGGILVYDRAITPYTFMTVPTTGCASQSGTVFNWCQRTDSRLTGNGYIAFPSLADAYLGGSLYDEAVIGWAFNADPDASHPRPYIRRVYFRVRDVAYLGRTELWSNSGIAFLYPALAVNTRGHVGMVFAWGGGNGTANYYPGWGVMLNDDISPTQPWTVSYTSFGAGNACVNLADGFRRWGDYLGIGAFGPDDVNFWAVGFRMNAATPANCPTNQSRPQVELRQIVFGRERDRPSYLRWWNR